DTCVNTLSPEPGNTSNTDSDDIFGYALLEDLVQFQSFLDFKTILSWSPWIISVPISLLSTTLPRSYGCIVNIPPITTLQLGAHFTLKWSGDGKQYTNPVALLMLSVAIAKIMIFSQSVDEDPYRESLAAEVIPKVSGALL
ncbi:hypothetical protein Tco_1287333, partial [Tanacetum coccineum]